ERRFTETMLEPTFQPFQVPTGPSAAERQIQGEYNRVSDPNYGFDHFRRLAIQSTPTLADFLSLSAAARGSSVMAREQFEAARTRAQQGAMDAFGAFRLNADQTARGLLGMLQEGEQFRTDLGFRAHESAMGRRFG